MRLTFLGTGAAFTSTAFNASYVLGGRVLVDAGSPVHVLIPRAGESVAAIDTVVITHQHGDHTFGLPFFLAARAIDHPDAPPLTIVTPPGFTAYIEQLFVLAWGARLWDLVMNNSHPTFIEVDGGESVDLAGVRLQAERMVHVPDIPCLGYAFAMDDVRFAFSGDCEPCPGLEAVVEVSDHVLVEMTGSAGGAHGHMSRQDVEELIARHPGKRFYLTHLNGREPVTGATIGEDNASIELEPLET